MSPEEQERLEDALRDTCGLSLALLDDNVPGIAAIMRNGDSFRGWLIASRLLAVVWRDTGCENSEHFIEWCREALDRQ